MKKYIIYKNCHYSTFVPQIKCLRNLKYIKNEYYISFDKSCKYDIEEKSCVNKLFGYSFGLFSVHKNSCRFGWTYNKETDKIDIWIYVYKDKKLNKYKFASCDFDVEYYFSIKTFLNNNLTIFNFNNENIETVNINVNNNIILTLGFYFGGSTRAPHKMHINYKK